MNILIGLAGDPGYDGRYALDPTSVLLAHLKWVALLHPREPFTDSVLARARHPRLDSDGNHGTQLLIARGDTFAVLCSLDYQWAVAWLCQAKW
jgi:hypothetical protein